MAYTSSHVAYKNYLEGILPEHAKDAPKAPVVLNLQFVMPRYRQSEVVTHRADLDNLEKILLDAMTKTGFWADDYLVTGVVKSKRFTRDGEEPHTKIRIRSVDDPDTESDRLSDI